MAKDNANGGDNPRARTLRRAIEVAGSLEQLAETLGVSPASVSAWLVGEQPLPNEIYLQALDLVSQGPHHQRRQKSK